MKRCIVTILFFATTTLWIQCSDPISGNTSETGNATVAGIIYQPNGTTPAAGAKVLLVPANQQPKAPGLTKTFAAVPESTITNANGVYTIDSLIAGTYNVLATASGNLAYQDSIVVKADSQTQVQPDTLKTPGSIRGRVLLRDNDDARLVFILFMGTNYYCMPDDSTGKFRSPDLAEGTYRVRILTTLDNYSPVDTTLRITAGKIDTLKTDIVLPFKGVPVLKGLKISYDTLKQIVTLSWNKENPTLVNGYYVYRRNVDSNTVFTRINTSPITDTLYRDSTGIQDQTYEYRVSAIDKNATEGTKSAEVSVKVVGALAFANTVGSTGTSSGQFTTPLAVAVNQKDELLLTEIGSGKVLIFEATGVLKREVVGLSKPIGICPKNDSMFYVLEKDSRLIKLINSRDSVVSQFGGIGTDTSKFGTQSVVWETDISYNGDLYVTDYGNDRIQVFNPDGAFKRLIPFNEPASIRFLDTNKIAISTTSSVPWSIVIVDTLGQILNQWSTGAVWSIETTKNGNIASVYEGKGEIHIFSQTGMELLVAGSLGTATNDQFEKLRTIAILKNNNSLIAVDDWAKAVKVFNLPSGL